MTIHPYRTCQRSHAVLTNSADRHIRQTDPYCINRQTMQYRHKAQTKHSDDMKSRHTICHTFQFLPLLQPAVASNSDGLMLWLPGRFALILSSSRTFPRSSMPVICLHTTSTSRGSCAWRPMMRQGILFSHGVPFSSCKKTKHCPSSLYIGALRVS